VDSIVIIKILLWQAMTFVMLFGALLCSVAALVSSSRRLIDESERTTVRIERKPKPAINGKAVDYSTPAGQRVTRAAAEFEAACESYLAAVGES
jgi:hypothetical protein